jgi:hypothetical protein
MARYHLLVTLSRPQADLVAQMTSNMCMSFILATRTRWSVEVLPWMYLFIHSLIYLYRIQPTRSPTPSSTPLSLALRIRPVEFALHKRHARHLGLPHILPDLDPHLRASFVVAILDQTHCDIPPP